MDGSVLEEKSSFKMLGLTFSSKLDWGSYIISIAKTASRKIGALICSMKFFSPDVALFWCPWLLLGIARQATKNEYAGLLVFHLLLLLKFWLILEKWPA